MTILHLKKSINRSVPRLALLLIPLVVTCFAPLRTAQGVVPPPDGGYPGFTTAEGTKALFNLTTGSANTAIGWYSLETVTTGSFNTGVGAGTLVLNSGDQNTATGVAALLLNTTGGFNTATGTASLVYNDTGSYNTAIGDRALFNNTTGDHNTAVGTAGLGGGPALFNNTIGRFNTAVGGAALASNTEGDDNTAIGAGALADNIGGDENVAVGLNALNNSTGNNNVALGNYAGFGATTGSNNVYIGNQIEGTAGESNACYIGSIFGQTASNGGTAVYVDASNKLGTLTSSKRFKEDIQAMGTASEALFALKPVTFHYQKEIDPACKSQLGLVAEEVEKVNPDLVVRDKEGKPYSVRYDQVNAMLLNEFLKEHRKNEEQGATIARQRKDFDAVLAQQQKQIDALTAGLQKVSAQIEASKPAPQVVNNP
jgi:Chaperone of endosialidase